MVNHIDLNVVSNEIFVAGYGQGYQSTYLPMNNIRFQELNISLHSRIIGSYFWWYLYSILSFQWTKYSLAATDRVTNPPTLLRIIGKSFFFFQQCSNHKIRKIEEDRYAKSLPKKTPHKKNIMDGTSDVCSALFSNSYCMQLM